MKSKVVKDIKIHLILEENEARWLKGLIQNPINSDNESDESSKIRKDLWDHLQIDLDEKLDE